MSSITPTGSGPKQVGPKGSPGMQRIAALMPQMTERVKTYGIGHLTTNGRYVRYSNGLFIFSPQGSFGAKWSDCGSSSMFAADILTKNSIMSRLVPFQIKTWHTIFPVSTNLIDAARDPVPAPQFTTHVIDLTDDNIVVDLTPWNRLHPNNLPFISLDDHPFKAAISRSIEDLKRRGLFERPLLFDPDASFVYFPKLLPGKTGIPDLPLDLAWLDPKRLLTAALGFRETETRICAQFSVKHYSFNRSDGCPETPQSFNVEINTDENEILQNRVWLQRALLTGDPDRMLNMLISLFKGFFFFNSSPSFRGPDESVRIYYFTKKYLRFVALMMLNFSNAEDRRGEVHPAISPLGM